jgi:hypothetical protein
MEKVRMEEVEAMTVALLPAREEMQVTINFGDQGAADNAASGNQSAGLANNQSAAVNVDEA